MLRRLLTRWLPEPTRSHRPGRPSPLRFEPLEAREVPAVTLATISQPQIPSDKPVFIPVTVTNTPNGAVTTTVSSDTAGVTATVLTGGRSVRFDISGNDQNGVPFTGSVTIRLFEDVAPLATQRIIDLVTSGFYTNKIFHRVADLFAPRGSGQENVIIQGGSPTGNGSGGLPLPDLPDEFNAQVTFASSGLVAMANATDDNNNSQFFFTDVGRPLSDQVQFLNFNHTIFGIVTDGFDTLLKMRNTPLAADGSTPTTPLTITGATVFTDTENAVIKLTPNNGFTGTANVMVTATDADGAAGQATQTFATTGVNDGVDSKPFLGPVANPTTTAGTPVTFAVPYTDIDGDPGTIVVRDTNFSGAPANFTFSIDQANRTVTITPNAGFTGSVDFKVGVRQTSATDTAANYDTQVIRLTVTPNTNPNPNPNPNPNTGPFTAEGSAPGLAAAVTVRNADGSVRFTTPVYDSSFTGGVRVAIGDINDDGKDDVVAVPGFGAGPIILVLDSLTGAIFRTVSVFDADFRGGLHLQVGDLSGLGYDQVLVGAGDSGGPRVTLLDLKQNKTLLNFFAGDANFRGGVDVDAADVFQGKGQMIVTGTGPGVAGKVSLFNAGTGLLVGSFAAGDPTDTTGIRVRVSDTFESGVRPIFVAPLNSADGSPETKFNPADFIDPDKPAVTPSSSSSNSDPSNIDLSSLFNN